MPKYQIAYANSVDQNQTAPTVLFVATALECKTGKLVSLSKDECRKCVGRMIRVNI